MIKVTKFSCSAAVSEIRFLLKSDKNQVTQVHVNSLRETWLQWLVCNWAPRCLLLWWVWECSWQSLAHCAVLVGSWFTGSVLSGSLSYHTAPAPVLFPLSLGCRRASGMSRASPHSAISSDRGRKPSAHSLFLFLYSKCTFWRAFFLWSNNLLRQSCDVVWLEDLKMA